MLIIAAAKENLRCKNPFANPKLCLELEGPLKKLNEVLHLEHQNCWYVIGFRT